MDDLVRLALELRLSQGQVRDFAQGDGVVGRNAQDAAPDRVGLCVTLEGAKRGGLAYQCIDVMRVDLQSCLERF